MMHMARYPLLACQASSMNLFVNDFQSIGQYHDIWSAIIINAPDHFHSFDDAPVNQAVALEEAFNALRSGFRFVDRKEKDQRKKRIMRELIEMSHEAFLAGDRKTGAHTLQECEGMIWPSRAQRVKYAVAAERRAFGEVVTYADVKVSPHPYEGSEADMSPSMQTLYAAARKRCLESFAQQKDFAPFVLVLEASKSVREIRHRSWKSARQDIQSLASRGEIQGYVRAQVVVSGMSGVLICDLEQPRHPHISARSLVNNYVCDMPRFHLDDPQVFE